MEENWEAGHPLRGPHYPATQNALAGFVPLHLELQPAGPSMDITRPFAIIGRHTEADVRLNSPEISRRHCKLYFRDGLWRVQDLQSLNGVFVNEDRAFEATLYDGDALRAGEFVFRVAYTAVIDNSPQAEMIRSIADVLPKAV